MTLFVILIIENKDFLFIQKTKKDKNFKYKVEIY